MSSGPFVYAAIDVERCEAIVLVPRAPVVDVRARYRDPHYAAAERELAIERAVDMARDAGIPVRVEGPLDATDVIALRAP